MLNEDEIIDRIDHSLNPVDLISFSSINYSNTEMNSDKKENQIPIKSNFINYKYRKINFE
jgi:hypothetical protein